MWYTWGMKRKLLIIAAVVLTIAVAVFAALMLGFFVYPFSMSGLAEVPEFDLLEFQWNREQEILADFAQYPYTIDDPFIVIDPYDLNPLCALIIFRTEKAGVAQVVVRGDDEFSTFTYSHDIRSPRAEVPVIGLYAGRTNIITLIFDGESREYEITTEQLPVDFPDFSIHASVPAKMAPGVTLFTAIFESYSPLLDNNAQVRGFLSNKRFAHGTSMIVLQNGNMLSTGDEFKQVPYHKAFLIEYNWLGKIFRIYDVPNAVHHGIFEMPNGDILAVSNNADMFRTGTREDVVIIIDRESGAVKKTYDFRKIIDETREPYHHFHANVINAPVRDWMHTNAAVFDPIHNAIIVSSPTQSMVISIDADTSEINWILGPHDGYSEEFSEFLLTPVGDDFEWSWAQHDPRVLDSGDPGIVDILLFDNGQNRSFYKEFAVPAAENYSRAVIYSIDLSEMTVKQVWQYGKELGAEYYATYLGNAQMLGDTVLVNFGGQLRRDGVPVDDLIQSVMGNTVTNSRVVEVTFNGDVVFEVSVHENAFTMAAGTYQATRIQLFSGESFRTLLGEVRGERVGTPYYCIPPEDFTMPPIYMGKLSADFSVMQRENDRLVIEGTLFNRGETRLLSRAYIVLRSSGGTFVYEANSGLNGRFFASIDLSELPSGEYLIAIVGATVEGNDAQGKRTAGHFRTGYMIRI